MKKLLFLGLVLLAFCSCGKNYPQMVKDKAEQYKKEGKIILNQSNDSTGKEHYIVYADAKAQVIGVDTLGEKVKEVKLGRKTYKALTLHIKEGIGLVAEFSEDFLPPTPPKEYTVHADGQLLEEGGPINFKVYKDKYIVTYSCEEAITRDIIFLNGEEDAYYMLDRFATDASGNINVLVTSYLIDAMPDSWKKFITDQNRHPNLYVESGELICKTTVSPHGKIIKQNDVATCDQVQIPIEAFASWDMLVSYVYEVVNNWNRIFQNEAR